MPGIEEKRLKLKREIEKRDKKVEKEHNYGIMIPQGGACYATNYSD